ncbi:MAG: hypothetical protein ACE5IK_11185 [Acidobacteriota bacterium]
MASRHAGEVAALFTHHLPLSEGVAAYQLFASRADGCVKILLRP